MRNIDFFLKSIPAKFCGLSVETFKNICTGAERTPAHECQFQGHIYKLHYALLWK